MHMIIYSYECKDTRAPLFINKIGNRTAVMYYYRTWGKNTD